MGNEAPPPFNSSSIHRLVAQQDVQPPTDASVGVRPSCDLLQVLQDPPDLAKPRDSGLRPTALGAEQTQASHRERIPPSHAPRYQTHQEGVPAVPPTVDAVTVVSPCNSRLFARHQTGSSLLPNESDA